MATQFHTCSMIKKCIYSTATIGSQLAKDLKFPCRVFTYTPPHSPAGSQAHHLYKRGREQNREEKKGRQRQRTERKYAK